MLFIAKQIIKIFIETVVKNIKSTFANNDS